MAGCSPPSTEGRLAGEVYGTRWSATWHGAALERPAVLARFEAVFEEIDRATSSWRDDAEIAGVLAIGRGGDLETGDTLTRALSTALAVAQASDGAFDPTVAPLVRLWGFGPEAAAEEPSEQQLRETRGRVDFRRLQLAQRSGGGRLLVAAGEHALELDLSGVAKGDAVDGMAEVLEGLGASDFLVEIGGEFVARGDRPGGGAWRVGIERPAARPDATPELWRALELRDAAVATSGNYRNVRGEGEARRGHTIDPRSGYPVDHAVVSATVVAPSCRLADALATALLVLGDGPDALALLEAFPGSRGHLLVAGPEGSLAEVTLDPGDEGRATSR